MRTLVSDVPTWGLVLLFVGGSLLVSGGGFLLVRRFNFRSPDIDADTFVSSFGGRASTLFGILLVFVIVSEYGSFQGASHTVRNEATGLAEIVRNTQAFPAAARDRIRGSIAAYVGEVVDHEWPLLEQGKESAAASARLDDVQLSIAAFEPKSESDKAFLDSAVSDFGTVVNSRRDRLDAAKEHIPVPLLALLFAGAIVFLATALPFSSARDSLLLTLVLIVAALTGAGLFATVVLDYPFSGSLAISPEAFHEGALRALLGP